MEKVTTIASTPLTQETTTTFLSYLHAIHESLALALEFLRGFQEAGWPVPIAPATSPHPSLPKPTSGSTKPTPSQIDQDLVVARHLALAATLRRLVDLDDYPTKGESWVEMQGLAAEAESISQWFAKNHGVREAEEEEMRELEAVWEWYVGVFEPALVGLVTLLRDALGDEARWEVLALQREEKQLPALPDGDEPSLGTVQCDSAEASSSSQIQRRGMEKASCRSALRPMLKSLLTRRAQRHLQNAIEGGHACYAASGCVHQEVRLGVGLRHRTSAKKDGHHRQSFRARIERASDGGLGGGDH